MTRFIINNFNGQILLSVDMITYVPDDYYYFKKIFDRLNWVVCSLKYKGMTITALPDGLLKVCYHQDDGKTTEDVSQFVVIDYEWFGHHLSVRLSSGGNMWNV